MLDIEKSISKITLNKTTFIPIHSEREENYCSREIMRSVAVGRMPNLKYSSFYILRIKCL